MKLVECAWNAKAELGEGPVWVASEQAVYFVDILGRAIHRLGPDGQHTRWPAPAEPGFLFPLEGSSFVCGLRGGLHLFDAADGSFSLLVPIEQHRPRHRLNDGLMDDNGRLWFGTMHEDCQTSGGALYSWRPGEALRIHDEGYIITNGPAISHDEQTLYHTDSAMRVVYAFNVAADGSLLNKRIFLRFSEDAYPDGMAVDPHGNLWIAFFNGWRAECYSPMGTKLDAIRFPCANITKPAFGGASGQVMYVTTASAGLTEIERQSQPLAGALFRVTSSS